MAITKYESIWSARIRKFLDPILVYRNALCNEDYKGEVRYGGVLSILGISDPTIEDHDGPWADDEWEALTDDDLQFTVTQKKRFKFRVGTEDQQGHKLRLIDVASQRAVFALGNTVDAYIAGKHSQVDSGNLYGDDTTPITVGFGSGEIAPLDALTNLSQVLAIANATMAKPNVVIPVWLATYLIQQVGARNSVQGDAANTIGPKQGLIYEGLAGWAGIYVSQNVPNTTATKYKVIGGDNHITLGIAVEQIKEVDLQNDFGSGVKGLLVYDAKLLQGEQMALGTFNKGTARVNP